MNCFLITRLYSSIPSPSLFYTFLFKKAHYTIFSSMYHRISYRGSVTLPREKVPHFSTYQLDCKNVFVIMAFIPFMTAALQTLF